MLNQNKIIACVLVIVTLLTLGIVPTQADSISDGNSTTVKIQSGTRHSFLESTTGTAFGGSAWSYTTNDGISGPAYCVNWGLRGVPADKELTISGMFSNSPKTMGAFAGGYPQRSLDDFIKINLPNYPELAGLTESEYGYATQIAVWASLGQVAIEGTAFTEGRATIPKPYSNAQKIRTFKTIEIILDNASYWDRPLQHSMEIRIGKELQGSRVDVENNGGLAGAASLNQNGIRKETINGIEYYTREFTAASGTSTFKHDYFIELWSENAPEGTIFTDENNKVLETVEWDGKILYRLPTVIRDTQINPNGSEYWGTFKICMPVLMTPENGEVIINSTTTATQYNIYLANNTDYTEQSYIIADPAYASLQAQATLKWETKKSIYGRVIVQKVDGSGQPLEGAVFLLEGTNGKTYTGTSDKDGIIIWEQLEPNVQYVLKEKNAPQGYILADPVNVSVAAGETANVTVKNYSEHTFRLKKTDAQNGYPLNQAIFRFEQIDGGYSTDAVTGHDGYISFVGSELPFGTYKVYEVQAPSGYQKDTSIQTVKWDGKQNVTIHFKNVRTPTLVLVKKNIDTNESIEDAIFNVYHNGALITSVTTNNAGEARIVDLVPGYYEVQEVVAPEGYILDNTKHGIYINPYDPATTDDPVLIVTNKAKGSLKIQKIDSTDATKGLDGVTLRVQNKSLGYDQQFITSDGGWINIPALEPADYTITEVATIPGYELSTETLVVPVRYGETATAVFKNEPHGKIIIIKEDSISGDTLPGANIMVTDENGKTWDVTTDKDGTADIDDLPKGQYVVQELNAPPGYDLNDQRQTVIVKPGETSYVKIQNHPFGSLVVTKIDSKTGQPMAGVKLRIYCDTLNFDKTEMTDTEGKIKLADLKPGDYTITEIATIPGYELSDEVITKAVSYGKETTVIFTNSPKGTAKVIKVDSITGEHLSGANIKLESLATGQTWDLTTDTDGIATVDDLPAGQYTFQEQNPPAGYELNNQVFPVTVVNGEISCVKIQNNPLGSLLITKIDAKTGLPLKGVRLRIHCDTLNFDKTEATDAEGKIKLTDLKPGDYNITEIAPIPGYELSKEVLTRTISYGSETTVTFKNKPLGSITIVKVDSITGEHLSGANIKLTNPNTGQTWDLTTGVDGTVAVDNLLEGEYTVQEQNPPRGYELNDQSYLVNVVSGENSSVKIQNNPLGKLEITKISSINPNETLTGVKLRVQNTAYGINEIYTTDEDGKIFIENLKPGDYSITEVSTIPGYVLSGEIVVATINYGKTTNVVFKNEPKPGLTILKRDKDTLEPLAGAIFSIEKIDVPENGMITGSPFTTNAEGKIFIADMLPGSYKIIEIQAPFGYNLADPNYQIITMRVGENNTVTFENSRQPSFILTKVDSRTGQPIEGVQFTIEKLEQPGKGKITGSSLFTNEQGQIIIPNLLSGAYRVTEVAPASGYGMANPNTWDITITANQDYNLKIKNTRLPSLVIHKKDGLTYRGIPNVAFEVYYAVNGSFYGDVRNLGTFTTNQDGQIVIPNCQPGWYRYIEVRPAQGYSKPSNPVHDVFLGLGDNSYNGVGGEAWDKMNGNMLNDNIFHMPKSWSQETIKDIFFPSSSSIETTNDEKNPQSLEETDICLPTVKPDGSEPNQHTNKPIESETDDIPKSDVSPEQPTLVPTKPNIDVLVPTKPNGSN